MKNIILLIVISLLILSCNERRKDSDLALIGEFCSKLLWDLDGTTASIENAVVKGGNRKTDVPVLNDAKLMKGWRNNYLKEGNKEALLVYSDSIIKHLSILENKQVLNDLIKAKNDFTSNSDSLFHLKLFFWTLKAETVLQANNASKVGADEFRCYLGGLLPSEISSHQISLGDSIYLTFKLSDYAFSDVKFNLDSLYIENQDLKTRIRLKPVKVGPNIILHTIPKQRGNYLIHGKIHTNLPKEFRQFVMISKECKVI
ncbi:hypothetical protein [Adhaeribacter soli]|nr:hypothetical protein [Adhaeribacter soli]